MMDDAVVVVVVAIVVVVVVSLLFSFRFDFVASFSVAESIIININHHYYVWMVMTKYGDSIIPVAVVVVVDMFRNRKDSFSLSSHRFWVVVVVFLSHRNDIMLLYE